MCQMQVNMPSANMLEIKALTCVDLHCTKITRTCEFFTQVDQLPGRCDLTFHTIVYSQIRVYTLKQWACNKKRIILTPILLYPIHHKVFSQFPDSECNAPRYI